MIGHEYYFYYLIQSHFSRGMKGPLTGLSKTIINATSAA
jgi:hypothetical protein